MNSVLQRLCCKMQLYYLSLLFVQQFAICFAQTNYQDLSCPQLLDCNFSKRSIEYTDPRTKCLHRVCICEGTNNKYSVSGSDRRRFEEIKQRFTNCTLVDGNLEIVDIDQNITFTKHIQEVTGYVLVSRITGYYIDLSSLRLIRGNEPISSPQQFCSQPIKNTNLVESYSLYVFDNSEDGAGLRELWMPNLSEISKGDVKFLNNANLCFANTIVWDEILHTSNQVVDIDPMNFTSCPSCSSFCSGINQDHCWGSASNLCQIMTISSCEDCGQGCVITDSNTTRCCDDDCAGGCFHQQSSGCYACRKLSYNGQCKESCPGGSQPNSAEETFQFAGYCLDQCPRNVPRYDKFCQTFCPEGTYDYSGNVCQKCENGVCNNICYGLGIAHGNLANDEYINANNIKYFNKNCTIIEGSLRFISSTFRGRYYNTGTVDKNSDKTCEVGALVHESDFEVFKNVREITGYLVIDEWVFRDLCVFKNLRKIHGKSLYGGRFALSIFAEQNPRALCFDSLKSINNGDVYIEDFSSILCHADKIDWNLITKNSHIENTIFGVKPKHRCAPCNRNCNSSLGCWGTKPEQCFKCQNYTDLTDADGKLTPEWITVGGKIYPGENVSTCVEMCDFSKGVYASSDDLCQPCDVQCKKECTGPGPKNCKQCLNLSLNSTCVADCSSKLYYKRNKTCFPCPPGCMNLGCNGPSDKFDAVDGCTFCHQSYDNETKTNIYRGPNCPNCNEKRLGCTEGCEETNGVYSCIVLPSDNTVAIVVPVVLVVMLSVFLLLIYWLRRNKSTIKQMRKTIGEKMVGEHSIDDAEAMPLSPSGATPNQAQLRIVKDHELVISVKLGSGAFGDVHKAIWNPMNIQGEKIKIAVAVKTLKVLEDVASTANNEIMDEAYVMASVDCDYLVRLLGIRLTKTVSLITQLMPLGSLLEYVRDVKQQDQIHSRQILTWFVQIAKGMLYLQEKHLVHRDLAARNVLVKTPNHVKITDFGLAKMLDIKEDYYQAEGGKLPIKWLAIECITERLFSHHSDVWAYGITCWEILTFGARPYDGVRAIDILSLLEKGERLLQPQTATIEVYMLLIKCWMVDRTCRPSFAELVAEFTRMAMDPSRYLVLKNDSSNCMSPNQIEEDKFFQMLMQEEKIDDALITDEPDQYLLNRDLTNQRAMYANQETVNKAQDSHQANNAPERLFSRSTPSANLESTAAAAALTTGVRSAEPTTRLPSTSDQDDVFAESSKQLNHVDHRAEVYKRKDSEDTLRYTEDPTKKTPNTQGPGVDYLIPTIDEAPGDFPSPQPFALNNDTYIESPPYQSGPPSSRSHGPSDPTYTPLATCEEQEEHDYMNANGGASKNFFTNEEYMVTGADSGIGEDSQSLLSRDTRAKQEKRSEWEQSVSSDENEQISIKDTSVQFKPESSNGTKKNSSRNPWSVSSDASSSSHNSSNAINNPGYIFLDASTSNNSNNNQNNNDKPV